MSQNLSWSTASPRLPRGANKPVVYYSPQDNEFLKQNCKRTKRSQRNANVSEVACRRRQRQLSKPWTESHKLLVERKLAEANATKLQALRSTISAMDLELAKAAESKQLLEAQLREAHARADDSDRSLEDIKAALNEAESQCRKKDARLKTMNQSQLEADQLIHLKETERSAGQDELQLVREEQDGLTRGLQTRLDKAESCCSEKDRLLVEGTLWIQSINNILELTETALHQIRHENLAIRTELEEASFQMQLKDQLIQQMQTFVTIVSPTEPTMNDPYSLPISAMIESLPETMPVTPSLILVSRDSLPHGMTNNLPAGDRPSWLLPHEQILQQLAPFDSQTQLDYWRGDSANLVTYGNEQGNVWSQTALNLNQGETLPFQATACLSV